MGVVSKMEIVVFGLRHEQCATQKNERKMKSCVKHRTSKVFPNARVEDSPMI